MERKFIRFVYNTSSHPRGEKIKTLNIITKVYDDENNLLYVKKPHSYALDNQIEIDIEGTDYKQYLPLHHFKHEDGNIIRKSNAEIQVLEAGRTQEKQKKEIEKQQNEQEKQNNENIIADDSKSDKDKLDALIKLYKGG